MIQDLVFWILGIRYRLLDMGGEMNIKVSISLFAIMLFFTGSAMATEGSRRNRVDLLVASSANSSTSHYVQWRDALHPDCSRPSGESGTRISVQDEALFSILFEAKRYGRRVGFYYEIKPSSGEVYGHATKCQLVNAWIERY